MDVTNEFEFLERIINLIKSENILKQSSEENVVNFLHPEELEEEIDFNIDNTCHDQAALIEICKKIAKYSIKTNNPNFYNQLYGGTDLYGYGGTILAESLNTNQHTYEVAPVFSMIERAVFQKVYKLVGYNDGDGIFSPGGSIANMYGMALARYKLYPEVKTKGLKVLPNLIAFTSEDAHYSLEKAVHWLGIGTDNLIKIRTDSKGRMNPDHLEEEILKGIKNAQVPFFVNATVGTTVLGAIDPLNTIAGICEKYNIWLHVDACYGGTLILSRKYRTALQGLSRSDSLSWNPHKMLGAPLQCSLFLTKHRDIMNQCNSASATYLFQQDKFYDVTYDTGDKSIQCGRKVDSFKLWMMWKARGDSGFEKLIDNAMDCARYFTQKIQNRKGFKLVQDEFECSTICFWYIPDCLKQLDKKMLTNYQEILNKVAPFIKEKLTKSGKLMITYSPLPQKGLCNFFRMVTSCHPPPNYEDMDSVITQIEDAGRYFSI